MWAKLGLSDVLMMKIRKIGKRSLFGPFLVPKNNKKEVKIGKNWHFRDIFTYSSGFL